MDTSKRTECRVCYEIEKTKRNEKEDEMKDEMKDEEAELINQIRNDEVDSNDAKRKIIRKYIRKICDIAHEYQNLGLPLYDLIENGINGLMEAVQKNRNETEDNFEGYAIKMIRSYMINALNNINQTDQK